MDIKISVVIPVYNSEKYLAKCVDTLINQTLKSVEFIFVDDGSTDKSVEIIKNYQKQDERIHLIQQRNLHAGVARNTGMMHAKGKYIIFLDSDDFFELDLLEKAFQTAELYHAEVTVFGHYVYDESNNSIREPQLYDLPSNPFSITALGERAFSAILDAPWNKLFLLSFLKEHGIKYQNIIRHNDVYFSQLSLALASIIVSLRERFVYYRVGNKDSLQGQKKCDYQSLITCFTELREALIQHGVYNDILKKAYCQHAIKAISKRAWVNGDVLLDPLFYSSLKESLVPQLFDSPTDFADDFLLLSMNNSISYDQYVISVAKGKIDQTKELIDINAKLKSTMKNDMVSKKSKDYIVGHWGLMIPRGLFRFMVGKKSIATKKNSNY